MAGFRVDLRSDTVTTPSAAMRAAMAEAEVGDAWYGDDPTANELQELAAGLTGKEAALFVPTGTMANQIALALQVRTNGHLVACSSASHVATTEVMTSAALSGIAFRSLDPGPRGWIDAAQTRSLLEPDSYFDVEMVDLLSVENTVGGAGGRVMPVDELVKVRAVADEAGVPLHLDGARVFNAAAAAGVDVHGVDPRGRHRDVLRFQGARRADRLPAVRSGGAHPRGTAALDPVRGCVAPGGDRGGRRDRRARARPARD